MYLLAFYVPETHVTLVKEALFAAGGGRLGDYEACAWQTRGEGQFRPLSGSQPFIGQTGTLETVVELKVEMVCDPSVIAHCVQALKLAHPYEAPAYHVLKMESF